MTIEDAIMRCVQLGMDPGEAREFILEIDREVYAAAKKEFLLERDCNETRS